VALLDRVILALHQGGARLLVGTDPGNPLVVPGFSVHDELASLVHAGLSPHAALRIATRDAAEFLGAETVFGTVTVGKRADLLVLDANPLEDITATTRIAGVMVRGRWLPAAELAGILAEVAATIDGRAAAFAGMPALSIEHPEYQAVFDVTWQGAYFGSERVAISAAVLGARRLEAQTFDPHQGQRRSLTLDAHRMTLSSDGAAGRGRATVSREGAIAKLIGTLLSGPDFARELPLPAAVDLGGEGFLAPKILVAQRLALAVGETQPFHEAELSLGSTAELQDHQASITRTPDVTTPRPLRRYELKRTKGPLTILYTDDKGWLEAMEIQAYGATVHFQKR